MKENSSDLKQSNSFINQSEGMNHQLFHSCSSLDNIIEAAALLEQCDEEEKNKPCLQTMLQHQQCLFLLRHAYECTHEGQAPCSIVRHCKELKILCNHVMKCSTSNCNFPHCISFRSALEHYASCESKHLCAICGPFVSSKNTVEKDMKISNTKELTKHISETSSEDILSAMRTAETIHEEEDDEEKEKEDNIESDCTSEEDIDESSPSSSSSSLSTLLNVANKLYSSESITTFTSMKENSTPFLPIRGNVHDANTYWMTKATNVITPKGLDECEGFECESPIKFESLLKSQRKRIRFSDELCEEDYDHQRRRLW